MAEKNGWTVGFPLYEGCTLLDFAGATQIFSSWVSPRFKSVWLAASLDPVRTSEEVKVQPSRCFDDPGPIDILFVPGGGPEVADAMQDQGLVDFVRRAGKAARFAGAVCTGAFIVAAAGLLDGCEATTYWSQRENLALFPRLRLAPGYPRWVISGDRFTGGGVSSSIDLALALIDRLVGTMECEEAQLSVQYAPDPPFHSGDPGQAPPEVTAAVLANQQEFIKVVRKATLEVIGKSRGKQAAHRSGRSSRRRIGT